MRSHEEIKRVYDREKASLTNSESKAGFLDALVIALEFPGINRFSIRQHLKTVDPYTDEPWGRGFRTGLEWILDE